MSITNKIKNKDAKVTIIGLGYVGLPLGVEIAKAGFTVIGIDKDKERINSIDKEKSYLLDVSSKELSGVIKRGKLTVSQSFEGIIDTDVIIICVPTPLTKNKTPDMSYIEDTTENILPYLRKGQLIILESTTYPGTTEEIILPKVREKYFVIGKDIYLVFSPERVDPGNKIYGIRNIPKILGGITKECARVAKIFYEQVVEKKVFIVSCLKVAEMEKLFENIFRNVNIALVNELAMLCERIGIDIWEVIEAAKTKPYGFMPFYPGPGVGGHCIPVDPYYLSWKAKEYNFNTKFIELAGEINDGMPWYIVNKIIKILNKEGKSIKNSNILMIGVTYKKDINDIRESPALKIAGILKKEGANLVYWDPFISEIRVENVTLHSVNLNSRIVKDANIVLITTDHSNTNYKMIIGEAHIIFDTRNVLRKYFEDLPISLHSKISTL